MSGWIEACKSRGLRQVIERWLPLCLLLGFGVYLSLHVVVAAGGYDSSGYLNTARMLADGHAFETVRPVSPQLPPGEVGDLLAPYAFRPVDGTDRLVPKYFVGFPLQLAVASKLLGWTGGPMFVVVGSALLGLAFTWGCARRLGLGRGEALAAGALLAVSPAYFQYSLQVMSDMAGTAWCTGALFFALIASHRGRLAWAAGACMGIAVLLRSGNALLFLPLVLVLPPTVRCVRDVVLGGLPMAIAFVAFNQLFYGAPIAIGHAGDFMEFSPRYLIPNLAHIGLWTSAFFGPLPLLFLLGMPGQADVPLRIRAFLFAWVACFAALYGAYEVTATEWWYTRYFLPTYPVIVVSGALVLDRLAGWISARTAARAGWLKACVWVLLLANTLMWNRHFDLPRAVRGEENFPRTAQWLIEELPSDALLVAGFGSGTIFFYTDFPIVRWDEVGAVGPERVDAALRSSGRPVYAVLWPIEMRQEALEVLPGPWGEVGHVDDIRIFGMETRE